MVDLGIENYGLPNMFLPFANGTAAEGRYRYYRKSTRGHNTLAFGDPGGFDPADAESSDQAVNIYSALTPGAACRHAGGHVTCGAGEVMVVNLSSAYGPRLPSGLPNTSVPVSSRPAVSRTFEVNSNMTVLIVTDVIDSVQAVRNNFTWAVHTRAARVVRHGRTAMLFDLDGAGIKLQDESVSGLCGPWQWAPVALPGGTLPNNTRFPLRNAQKVWLVCNPAVSKLTVSISDLQ